MPLGIARNILTGGAAAPSAGAGEFSFLAETTAVATYKPVGTHPIELMGTDANTYPVCVLGLGNTSSGPVYARRVYGVRFDTANNTFSLGSTYATLTAPTADRNLIVTGNSLGGDQYQNAGASANTESAVKTKTGSAEYDGISLCGTGATALVMSRLYVRQDTLALRTDATVTVSNEFVISGLENSSYDACCVSGDNWGAFANRSGTAVDHYAGIKRESVNLDARGGALNTFNALNGAPALGAKGTGDNHIMKIIPCSPPGGRLGVIILCRSTTAMQHFAWDLGTGTTGAWSGTRVSAVSTYGSSASCNPQGARLLSSKVVHGVKDGSDFLFVVSDPAWGGETTWSTTSTNPTVTNSTVNTVSYGDGVMLIDSGTNDKFYLLRYTASSKQIEIVPYSVSGTTATAQSSSYVYTTSTYSDFGKNSGITRYGNYLIGVAHDGTDSKLFAIKKI